jgi:V/A-type H+-transporting ATPase subunit C
MKYDTHNAKVLLKAEAMGTDPAPLFSRSGRIAPEKLTEAYHEGRYSDLPETFGKALEQAKSTLARTANPQLADFVLDRAMYEEMLDAAEKADCPFLKGYVRLLIDSGNLKSLVRTARMHKDADFLREVLIPGGSVDTDRLSGAGDGEGLTALFAHSPLEQAAARGEEALSGGNLTAFERACDNAVNSYLRSAKLVSYGPEAPAAYLAAVEGEITAARMILTGRLSGIAPETIRERLRDLYA